MRPIILFRPDRTNEHELEAAHKYFTVKTQRAAIPEGSLVIGRYSVLPYYKELEVDVDIIGSKMINTYTQHRYIADIGNWYRDLRHMTPKTWTGDLRTVPDDAFPIVIKGETNSKKFQWDTHMFAKDREAAARVVGRLQEDGLISEQGLYYRKYEELNKHLDGFRGMPVTNEYRCFVLDGQVLTVSFYWSNYIEDIEELTGKDAVSPMQVPAGFLQKVIEAVGKNARFYVVDVAQKKNGDWIVIELNDGQMSGLSCTDPMELYQQMAQVLLHKNEDDDDWGHTQPDYTQLDYTQLGQQPDK